MKKNQFGISIYWKMSEKLWKILVIFGRTIWSNEDITGYFKVFARAPNELLNFLHFWN